MANTLKKILLAAAGTGIIAGGIILGSTPAPLMTITEFNNLIKIYDYEIDAAGGDINLMNIKNNALAQFDQLILDRVETKSVNINGHVYSASAYMTLRNSLITKAEKNKLNN
jgi:hypothetical protein